MTDFSFAQQRKPQELRRCTACVWGPGTSGYGGGVADRATIAAAASRSGGALLREVFTGFGAQAYWNWVLSLHRVLLKLPKEVTPQILAFLGIAAGCHGVAEIGALAVCSICDTSWPRALQSAESHCRGRRHKDRAARAVAERATARECAEAARAAGVLSEALAAEAARAAAASRAVATVAPLSPGAAAGSEVAMADPLGLRSPP
eukprot:CAMPEP_0115709530 /NCGR_PEP_ID=MMETSP0272-20121206/72521_1 /TAXON_ID=71861 /ORGANISM="Scrippsiella trochoidea, Strain CCMP3099" /LENGTH=204 /DNA_ID=CAMNT_0003151147 /DNA_START=131 /DNA_END=742 /DNA_ORIENTATION=+